MATAEAQLHSFLTSILDEGEWSSSRPARFTRTKKARAAVEQKAGWAPGQ